MRGLVLAGTVPVGGATRPQSVATQPGRGLHPMFLMAVLATVTMLFAAFTAALLIRRGGADWMPVRLPGIVWANAVVIAASSGLLELARRSVRAGNEAAAPVSLALAAVLGFVFLGGQLLAWSELMAAGVFLPTSPHAAFFYMLSGVHGVHVLGGLAALAWTLRNALHGAYSARMHRGLAHAAVYWHFVGALWIYLLVLIRLA